jgi:hypothetical protein
MTMLTSAPTDPAQAPATTAAAPQPTQNTAATTAPAAAAAQQATTKQDPGNAGSEAPEQSTTTNDGKQPPGTPERYDFKPIEGGELDAQVLTAYSEVARELQLSQEAAQKVLDKVAPVIAERQQATLKAQVEQARNDWKTVSKADKEFGGRALDANVATAKKALDAFGTPELRAFLEESGLGNHPEVIRLLYRAGRAISSDHYVGGREPARKPAPRSFEEHLANLYPSN